MILAPSASRTNKTQYSEHPVDKLRTLIRGHMQPPKI
jgi:hypothetical protein